MSAVFFFFFFLKVLRGGKRGPRGPLGQVIDGRLQRARVGARHDRRPLGLGEEVEGGDGGDAELLGEIGDLVDVELGEGDGVVGGQGVGVLLEEGGDGFAGAAPSCAGLDGDRVGVADELVELLLGGDGDDGHGGEVSAGGGFREAEGWMGEGKERVSW